MSVVTKKDFEIKIPEWVTDPEIDDEVKNTLMETGMGNSYSTSELMEVNDLCFGCGEKLLLPYVYWNGSHGDIKGERKGISLHADCAKHLARGITKDALKIESEETK